MAIRARPYLGLAGVFLLVALIAASYAASAEIHHLSSAAGSGAVVIPAIGVTLAALLLLPRRLWPLVLAVAFISQLISGLVVHETPVLSVGSAVASVVGSLVGGAILLAWTGGPPMLSRRRHLLTFVAGAAVIGAGLGALIRAAIDLLMYRDSMFVTVLARSWTGAALGVLIVGGLLLAWLTETTSPIQPRYRALEVSALAASAGCLSWLAFWAWRPGLTYLCLLPLGWAAIRFGARGATAVATLLAAAGEWGTLTDHGLFATVTGHDEIQAVWLLQLFLAIAVLGGLVLACQVAELGRAEEALRNSERAEREARLEVREAHAAERSRLARELHDSVSQALFSMTMHARTAQLALELRQLTPSGPLARAIGHLRELATGAQAEMRALIFDLRPDALVEGGLVAALGRRATALSAREQVPITVHGPRDALPLSAETEQNIYRIALEALHNTIKHAAATHVTVTVAVVSSGVRVSVVDDGSGFDQGNARRGHFGLESMHERAKAVGGDLQLISAPGAGTRVLLTVPATAAIGSSR